jgi:hypothetical protein
MAVTLANVSAATSSTQIFAASTSVDPRALGQRLIWNDSTATMYVNLAGGTASATAASLKIPPDGLYEFPRPIVTGAVTAIWSAATGTARTTEVS